MDNFIWHLLLASQIIDKDISTALWSMEDLKKKVMHPFLMIMRTLLKMTLRTSKKRPQDGVFILDKQTKRAIDKVLAKNYLMMAVFLLEIFTVAEWVMENYTNFNTIECTQYLKFSMTIKKINKKINFLVNKSLLGKHKMIESFIQIWYD